MTAPALAAKGHQFITKHIYQNSTRKIQKPIKKKSETKTSCSGNIYSKRFILCRAKRGTVKIISFIRLANSGFEAL